MMLRNTALFLSSAFAACVVTLAGTSTAAYHRIFHHTVCAAPNDYVTPNGFGTANYDLANAVEVLCGIEHDSAHPIKTVTTATAYVIDSSPSEKISVAPCIAYHNIIGGACSVPSSTSIAHNKATPLALGMLTEVWKDSDPNDLPYVNVSLPKSNGGPVLIKGFRIEWP